MSPLWGFDLFGYPHCYKHVAPLGLWLFGALVIWCMPRAINMPPLRG